MNSNELEKVKADAEKGDTDAQRYLGFLYYLGDTVSKDYVQAYKWLTLCEQHEARVVVQQIVKKMTVDEIAEAQKRIVAFIPNPKKDEKN